MSAGVLVAANLVPVYGVLALGWAVFPLVALFWIENVIIGALNVVRMLCVAPASVSRWVGKLFMIPAFLVHYGLFTLVHGAFVFSGLFGGKDYEARGLDPSGAALRAVDELGLWIPVAVLAASHVFSFCWNDLRRGELRGATLERLMFRPYARVVLLHFAIGLGALAAVMLGSPDWALLLLLLVKTGIDLIAHLREHRAAP